MAWLSWVSVLSACISESDRVIFAAGVAYCPSDPLADKVRNPMYLGWDKGLRLKLNRALDTVARDCPRWPALELTCLRA